jgi:hypothetical protein
MKRVKGLPVYLPPDLRSRAELIAHKRRRALSPQIVLWVERVVDRIERRDRQKAAVA